VVVKTRQPGLALRAVASSNVVSGLLLALLTLITIAGQRALADDVRAAVASNFSSPMQPLSEAFERETHHHVVASYGATGVLFTQIQNGAPFDVYLAADDSHPRLLEKNAIAVSGSRFTYAIGQLALWSAIPGYVDGQGKVLRAAKYKHIALSNPQTTPYGSAAKEYLRNNGLLQKLKPRFVVGENVAQAYQFVESGRAELGFIALSQLAVATDANRQGSLYLLPLQSYPRLKQQAILLRHNDAAAAWLAFLQSDKAREIIRQHGYLLP